MLKPGKQNDYDKFMKMKRKFAQKVKQGKKFKDTDGDGLSDYEEKYIYGTDPKNPDTDGDGMNDGKEVKRGRNPLGPGTFKDLFIPHAGNNYQPHALKPKRLLFHAASILVIKSIVVVFILIYPLSAWLSPDMALAEAKKIIALTNNLRQAVSLPSLQENIKLNQAAQEKVEDMILYEYFAHVSPTGVGLKDWLQKINYKYSIAGENLAIGFSRAEDVVAAWKKSPTHYDNIIESRYKEIGVAVADGRFKQVDTAYIAQYFGAQQLVKEVVSKPEVVVAVKPTASIKPETVNNQTPEKAVEGKKVTIAETPKTTVKSPATSTPVVSKETITVSNNLAATTTLSIENTTEKEITIDQQAANLILKKDPLNNSQAIQIEVTLPEYTISAVVSINGKEITLNKISDQNSRWFGVSLIDQTEEKNILNPLIPASITLKSSAGVVSHAKIDWDQVNLIETTPLEHYALYKNYPAEAMTPIIDLSNLYFKILLCLALMAMLLNIFIEIKRQHPHIILYSFAFISLLIMVIII